MSLRVITAASLAAICCMTVARPAAAQSGLDACGNIWVEPQVNCEVEPPGIECEARCTPLVFEAACAADLAVSCQGSCDVDISAELPSCEASCMTECTQQPSTFACYPSCEARCGANCSASCSGNSDYAHCEASCHASCGINCDTACVEIPGTVDCETTCQHSCEGSLKADLTVDCQAECQASGFVDCEARLDGGCKVDCTSSDGALFCDGQWVDHDNNLDKCIDALKNLGGNVEIKASGEISVGCSVADAGASTSALGLLPLIGLFAGLLFLRRRSS